MALLNQIIAIEKGVKSRAYAALSEFNKAIQKPDLFNGGVRSYEPLAEGGEALPSERKRVQFVVPQVLRAVEKTIGELMVITARKDWTNCKAKADVIVDGNVLLTGVPVTFLLFLEKQLTDLRTFVDNLPTLDDAEDWNKDPNSDLFRSEPVKQHRTQKVQEALVMYPATPQHPAQTQIISRDLIAGHWTTVKQSGALPRPARNRVAERIEKLLRAVKQAREMANVTEEAETPDAGALVFGYLLSDV